MYEDIYLERSSKRETAIPLPSPNYWRYSNYQFGFTQTYVKTEFVY